MTIRVNRWHPDTCACIIDYSWDDALPQDQIVLTPTVIVSKCSAHTSLNTPTSHYSVLMDENPRKNLAHQHILDNGPSTIYDIVDGTTRQLKKGMSINLAWSGTSPNRVLTLTLVGATLTTAQKNTIQGALNTKFGTGKVLIG